MIKPEGRNALQVIRTEISIWPELYIKERQTYHPRQPKVQVLCLEDLRITKDAKPLIEDYAY